MFSPICFHFATQSETFSQVLLMGVKYVQWASEKATPTHKVSAVYCVHVYTSTLSSCHNNGDTVML